MASLPITLILAEEGPISERHFYAFATRNNIYASIIYITHVTVSFKKLIQLSFSDFAKPFIDICLQVVIFSIFNYIITRIITMASTTFPAFLKLSAFSLHPLTHFPDSCTSTHCCDIKLYSFFLSFFILFHSFLFFFLFPS